MGVFWHVPGFAKNLYDTRPGATQTFWDENKHYLTIDGYIYNGGYERMLADLKLIGAAQEDAENTFLVTHWHGDHYEGLWKLIKHKTKGKRTFNVKELLVPDPDEDAKGLRDNEGSEAVKRDLDRGRKMIKEAKDLGIKVTFLKSSKHYNIGDIKFQAFRERPDHVTDSDRHGWEYLNWGSFFCWFKSISYLAVGDGPKSIGDFCKKHGIKPKIINGVHHGNGMARIQSQIMYDLGVRYYWDNDLSKGITPFLETGREDAIAVGMKFISIIGDINGFSFNGYFYVIHGSKTVAKYKCEDPGVKFKSVVPLVVRRTMNGTYGTGDHRVTCILKNGFAPIAVLNKMALVKKTARNILSGKEDYGRNKARLKALDKKFGKGFGQLIQDYINVLAGVRDNV